MAYFPAAVFLGKVQGSALATGLLVELGWIVFLIKKISGIIDAINPLNNTKSPYLIESYTDTS